MSKRLTQSMYHVIYISFIAALGGFLMGFDASVISGVVKFIEPEFELTKIELGWAVACLSLTATLAMMISGPLSDKFGRKAVLKMAAALFFISAVLSALAPSFTLLVLARMLGGFGVGAALIIAPMYIAEIAPARYRGRLVSLNQLNIVIGITVAFFSNYLILSLSTSDAAWLQSFQLAQWNWRWMLGIEALPALIYFLALWLVPESPRWLMLKGDEQQARKIIATTLPEEEVEPAISQIKESLTKDENNSTAPLVSLFKPAMKLVLIIGVSVAILQQITGINAVFFYAPMIFEQTGMGTDAAFMQAIFVGITNLVFTIVAIALIDRIGRKALLIFGVGGIAVCMFSLALQFAQATYTLDKAAMSGLPDSITSSQLSPMQDVVYQDDLTFKSALRSNLGQQQAQQHESTLIAAAIEVNQHLVLVSLLGFVACFAMSLGPVMWVLFSELFPNRIRGIAISFVGLINSATSFLVQLIFPWELATLGVALTFAMYGIFAVIGLVIIYALLPETKGKTLEQLEAILVRN
ncbi:sugar porter family MFS transporter [Aliiglaciecola litoralis]|uniref:Major facilitator superfamily (MFS) profile domain-containing protein n=1 Tax=Aliiglaciecola litoralis TaxID=582857 RepID=A0ABN1LQ02_9ALTE